MKWIASLSDGTTVSETDVIDSPMSPWQTLLARLRDNPDLRITQLRLQNNGVTLISIPGQAGYVQCRRVIASGVVSGHPKEKQYGGIGAVIGDFVYLIWISDDAEELVYQSIEPFQDYSVHAWTQARVLA